jgi:hypothetical protein
LSETNVGDIWQCEIIPSDLQQAGKIKGSNHIEIIDRTPPVISTVIADPSLVSQGDFVNISCFVSDNTEIHSVMVNITGPSGFFPVNVTMNINSCYYYNMSYSIAGEYRFFIWANDTSNNTNRTQLYTFTINDILPPSITQVTADPMYQNAGSSINISCIVSDISGVTLVKANITYPDCSSINATMLRGQKFYLNTTYIVPGEYSYVIWACDTYNNTNESIRSSFFIQDWITWNSTLKFSLANGL